VSIFATAGVFATIKCVIYVDVHYLCMFSFDFADVRVPPLGCIIGFRRIFFVSAKNIPESLANAKVSVRQRCVYEGP